MVSKTAGRIGWIDVLKLVTIYFVVWGHVILFMGLPSDEVYSDPVCSFIYSFHMPLFMMISGFFSTSIIRKEGNIKKKFIFTEVLINHSLHHSICHMGSSLIIMSKLRLSESRASLLAMPSVRSLGEAK